MEKKRYFIYAYEEFYSGLHGIYDYCFYYGTERQACDIGYEMSYDLIESYSFLELCDEDATEDEREEAIQEDIAYEVWELREDAPSDEELEELNLDPESYISDYCVRMV